MIASCLAIVVILLPFILQIWKEHRSKNADPVEQNRKAYEDIQKPITKPSVALSDSLDEFDRLRKSNHQQ